jgi:hypothetical protein
MNTLEQLQKHLTTEVKEIYPGYAHKSLAPTVVCKDGTTLSVQASKDHYSTPREDFGPYTAVEVWCITAGTVVTEFEYSDGDPSGYVLIEAVAQFIDNHGGMES